MYKDIKSCVVSFNGCSRKLVKGKNNITYTKCWNWNISRAKYSKELITSISSYTKKLHKLSLRIQQKEASKFIKIL